MLPREESVESMLRLYDQPTGIRNVSSEAGDPHSLDVNSAIDSLASDAVDIRRRVWRIRVMVESECGKRFLRHLKRWVRRLEWSHTMMIRGSTRRYR